MELFYRTRISLLSLTLSVIFLTQVIFAQTKVNNYINGRITDAAGNPIQGCSVYFSNTSKGDVTNSEGAFVIRNLPLGKYELVVSAIGYQTYVMVASSDNYPHDLKITLQSQPMQLSEVTVEPVDVDAWRRWGKHFTDNFIGTTFNSNQCRLVNYKAIKFRYSEKTRKLTARSYEPLIIENRALGYTIKFQLEEFSSDLNTHVVYYIGYPFFQEKGSRRDKRQNSWKKNRRKAYYGSMLHFMRSVYNNHLEEDGYILHTNVSRPNTEKQRIKKMKKSFIEKADSTAYYKKVLKQPDTFKEEVYLTTLDSMMMNNENRGKILFFHNKLDVIFKPIPTRKIYEKSEIYLQTPLAIEIQENGSYFSPMELIATKHWSLYEKLSNMLPFDYVP